MPTRYADSAAMVVVRVKEPRSVKEAMTLPERQNWIDAMKAELDALVENGTWEVVDEPNKGTNIVDSKWVLKIKFDANGDVERFKARLVARGFSQKYGVNFSETFASVIKTSNVRLFLHYQVCLDYDCLMMTFLILT